MPPRGLTEEEKQAAQDYEYFSMNYHREKYGDDVWHASLIPEEELYAAGVFHNYNSRRLMRNAQFRELEKNKKLDSPYLDDGIDFLIKTPAPANTKADASAPTKAIYRVGQSKFYTKRKVPNRELAGFYRNMARMRTSGYLYTSTPLEIGLREDLMNQPDWFTHTLLKYDAGLTAQASSSEPKLFKLRPYQIEAVDTIVGKIEEDPDDAQMILQMGCGLGKTLIATRTIQRLMEKAQNRASSSNDTPPSRLFVCIAPLRISVSNLYYRIMEQISNTPNLVVDSDSYGTTDPDTIRKFLERDRTQIVFATYDSFKTLLMGEFADHLHVNDTFLIVDEAHNLTPEMCEMVNTFGTQLLMSATFPEQLKDLLDAKPIYNYGMSRGMNENFIVDYEVILPLLTRNDDTSPKRVAVDFPSIFPKEDLTAQALFLTAGMLQTGSRRCIVYLNNHEECTAFQNRMRSVCEEYHGIRVWSATMEHTMTNKQRETCLQEFQKESKAHDFFIITSVRILDEAIDIPRCDSEFIVHVGHSTSDIRTIQRLQRGGRLDPMNVMKKNHLFMWCDEWSKALNALAYIKEEDPMFHKKIKIFSASYDKIGDARVLESIAFQQTEINNYIRVHCMNADEIWNMKYVQLQEFCRENKCLPSDKANIIVHEWVSYQKKLFKLSQLKPERLNKLLSIPEFDEWCKTFHMRTRTEWKDNMKAMKEHILEFNDLKPKNKTLQRWYYANIYSAVKGTLKKELLDELLAVPIIKKDYDARIIAPGPLRWDVGFEQFKNELANKTFKYRTTNPVGYWLNMQISYIRRNNISDDRKAKLFEVPEFQAICDKAIANYSETATWMEKFEQLKMYEEEGLAITQIREHMNSWCVHQKYKIFRETLSKDKLELFKTVKVYWDWVIESKAYLEKKIYTWEESFEMVKVYYDTENALPNDVKTHQGCWMRRQKDKIMENKLTDTRKKALLNLPLFREWYAEKSLIGKRKLPSWSESYQILLNIVTKKNELPCVTSEPIISKWLCGQKKRLIDGKLTDEQRQLLLAIPKMKEWYDFRMGNAKK
jgi:superfamily II DNA or RNA helicase